MDDEDFQPMVSNERGSEKKDDFINKIVSAYRRIESMKATKSEEDIRSTFEEKQLGNDLDVDWEKWTFKISITGFNYIRKQLGITHSANKFAEAHGYEYGSIRLYGSISRGITGEIPEEYRKEEKPSNSKEDHKNEEEREKKDEDELNEIFCNLFMA